MICAILLQNQAEFHCTSALNSEFSVAPNRISPLWRTFAMADYNNHTQTWLSPALAALRYEMYEYFRFCGSFHVCGQSTI